MRLIKPVSLKGLFSPHFPTPVHIKTKSILYYSRSSRYQVLGVKKCSLDQKLKVQILNQIFFLICYLLALLSPLHTYFPFHSPKATTDQLSISAALPIWDILCEWNYITCSLLLASFNKRSVFKVCPSVQFIHYVVSYSLRTQELQHTRPPGPSPTPRVYLNSSPSSQ